MYQKPTKNSIAFFNEHHDTVARFTLETFTGLSPICFDPLDTTHQVSNARFAEVRDTWTLKFYRALTALLQLDNPEFANSLGSLEEYDIDILLVLYEVCRQSLAANPYGTLSAAHYRFLLTANVPTQEREALCVAQATQQMTTEDVLYPEYVFSTAEPPVQANTNEGNVLLLGDSGFCYKKKKGFTVLSKEAAEAGFTNCTCQVEYGGTLQEFIIVLAKEINNAGVAKVVVLPVPCSGGSAVAARNYFAFGCNNTLVVYWNFNDFVATSKPGLDQRFAEIILVFANLVKFWPNHVVLVSADAGIWGMDEGLTDVMKAAVSTLHALGVNMLSS